MKHELFETTPMPTNLILKLRNNSSSCLLFHSFAYIPTKHTRTIKTHIYFCISTCYTYQPYTHTIYNIRVLFHNLPTAKLLIPHTFKFITKQIGQSPLCAWNVNECAHPTAWHCIPWSHGLMPHATCHLTH